MLCRRSAANDADKCSMQKQQKQLNNNMQQQENAVPTQGAE